VLLQSYDCKIDKEIDWSINIAPGESKDRPKLNQTGSFTILQLSDFHYDPGYVPGGNADCGEPICCQEDQGEPSSSDKSCGYWSDYRDSDPPWYLVEETIRQAKTQVG
jgi:sphingomyelin phosphodiesterase